MTDISIVKNGPIGHITLTRPKVLNALSHQMALQIETALREWADDTAIKAVMIDAEGDRAFCAGGDVQDLYAQGQAGDFKSGVDFWRDEYRLNLMIANYSKPYIAVMNGIVMGGGVGISAHGSHRIVTENTGFALPECAIGLIPDVGSSHLLAQAPGFIGEYLALTGGKVDYKDAIYCGFADYYIPSTWLKEMNAVLLRSGNADAVKDFAESVPLGILHEHQSQIDTVFSLETVDDIINKLTQLDTDWSNATLKKIKYASPIAAKVSFECIRLIRQNPGIENALKQEFRFVSRAMEHGDFLEGVRAIIIDKDRKPKWRYATISDVPKDGVDLFLSAPEDGDLKLV